MTKTLEQAVGDILKFCDGIPMMLCVCTDEKTCFSCLADRLRKAYEEREKRLPYQIILENGLAKIEQRLEDVLARLPQIPLKVEVSKWATGKGDA